MYKGIPAHRNKCSTRRIRKIIFPDEFEADATYTAQGPSPMKAGGDGLGTSAVRRDESDLNRLYAVPGVVPDLGPPLILRHNPTNSFHPLQAANSQDREEAGMNIGGEPECQSFPRSRQVLPQPQDGIRRRLRSATSAQPGQSSTAGPTSQISTSDPTSQISTVEPTSQISTADPTGQISTADSISQISTVVPSSLNSIASPPSQIATVSLLNQTTTPVPPLSQVTGACKFGCGKVPNLNDVLT